MLVVCADDRRRRALVEALIGDGRVEIVGQESDTDAGCAVARRSVLDVVVVGPSAGGESASGAAREIRTACSGQMPALVLLSPSSGAGPDRDGAQEFDAVLDADDAPDVLVATVAWLAGSRTSGSRGSRPSEI